MLSIYTKRHPLSRTTELWTVICVSHWATIQLAFVYGVWSQITGRYDAVMLNINRLAMTENKEAWCFRFFMPPVKLRGNKGDCIGTRRVLLSVCPCVHILSRRSISSTAQSFFNQIIYLVQWYVHHHQPEWHAKELFFWRVFGVMVTVRVHIYLCSKCGLSCLLNW